MYKVIAKFLTNRLRSVISGIVDERKSTFIKDRHILHGMEFSAKEFHVGGSMIKRRSLGSNGLKYVFTTRKGVWESRICLSLMQLSWEDGFGIYTLNRISSFMRSYRDR